MVFTSIFSYLVQNDPQEPRPPAAPNGAVLHAVNEQEAGS